MKKLLTLFTLLAISLLAGCDDGGLDNIFSRSYDINGAIQKGPFVQGSNITIQPLNKQLKPIGQSFATYTTNDAGMFEMDDVNSKYAEIIATGYYFDEVEGKISSGPLTLRTISDLSENTQTNVNILTSLIYNRIKYLVSNENMDVWDANQQAECELYEVFKLPQELRPSISCNEMNIVNNSNENGFLLAISIVLQDGRTAGELTEYIAKFSSDFANDGMVESSILDKIIPKGEHLYEFEEKISNNLKERYKYLGVKCDIPSFIQYLPYFYSLSNYCIIPFTYHESYEMLVYGEPLFHNEIPLETDVQLIDYKYADGKGEFCLSSSPTIIYNCEAKQITSITIPSSVTTIKKEAFRHSNLSNGIILNEGLTTIEQLAFETSNLQEITIPQSVTYIGKNAFDTCWSLINVTILGNIDSINKGCFNNCLQLTNVVLPESIINIYDYAFEYCQNLKNINIPNNVEFIGHNAFGNCDQLVSINIPSSIKLDSDSNYIGLQDAFQDCDNLSEFTGSYASEDGKCILYNDNLLLVALANLTEYSIPEGVTRIIGNPFVQSNNCDLLSLTLPESLIEISYGWNSAFFHNIESVYCKPTTPPLCPDDMLFVFGVDFPCKIYVPTESVEAYKNADGWSDYASYIVGYDL